MRSPLAFLLCFISLSHCAIEFRENENTFEILVDGVKVFEHSEAQPLFTLSNVLINFENNEGNFIITEEVESGPLALDAYSVSAREPNYELKMFNKQNEASPQLTFTFEEGDVHEESGVKLSCSYKAEITQGSDEYNRIEMKIISAAGEKIYGLGEQFSYLNLKGESFTIWTREQGVGRNRSYPLTQLVELGKRGAGGDYHFTYWPQASFTSVSETSKFLFYLDSYAYCIFDFGNDQFNQVAVQSNSYSGKILVNQGNLMNLVQNTAKVFGLQRELPHWVYNGAIFGVQGGTARMLQKLNEIESHGVAVSAVWIQDWSGQIYTQLGTRVFWNWRSNFTMYPQLDSVIKILKTERNIRMLNYLNPHLNTEGDLYFEGKEQGVFLKDPDNPEEPYEQNFGGFYCGSIDFWNPDAVNWYKSMIINYTINLGFSGWMADFGEYTPIAAKSTDEELTGQQRHNLYPVLWAKLNREVVEENNMENEIMFWTRSGARGASKYSTLLWGGDQNVNWHVSDGLPSAVIGGLSAAMSGMGLYHFDIGLYTTLRALNLRRSKELFLRSAEFSVFTPIMRTHEGNQPEENHQLYTDEDTMKQFGRLTSIYKDLAEYAKLLVKENAEMGSPVMRPLFLSYEHDPKSYEEEYQYLYGSDLLVAPVLEEAQTEKSVYLPPDRWIHLWDNTKKVIDNPSEPIIVPCPCGYPPVFYRAESQHKQLFESITDKYANLVDPTC